MTLESLYGQKLAPDLIALVPLCLDSSRTSRIGDFFPLPSADWLPSPAENSMEFMMGQTFRIYSLFSNCVCLGTNGAGDHWYFSLYPHTDRTPVFLFNHDASELQLAHSSIEEFLNFQKSGRKINSQTSRSQSLNEQLSFQNYGIATHLHGQWPGHTPTTLTLMTAQNIEAIETLSVAEILAYVWWLFLTSEDIKLQHALTRLQSHSSRLVHDASLLLQEVLAGRKNAGPHQDISKLRKK